MNFKLITRFLLCILFSASFCHSAELNIDAKLYFGLTELTEEARKHTVYVPEWFYTTLEDNDSHLKFALVGPLMPCVLIGLRNEENQKAVIFHKHFSNSMDSLVKIAQKELQIRDPDTISGIIFTNNSPEYEEPRATYFGSKSMRDLHQGKTQLEEIKFIKDFLIDKLNITDRKKIAARRHSSNYNCYDFGDYPFSFESVLIDSKLNAKNICMIHERIFCEFGNLPFLERFSIHKAKKYEYLEELLKKHFLSKVGGKELNTYNCVHFEKVFHSIAK